MKTNVCLIRCFHATNDNANAMKFDIQQQTQYFLLNLSQILIMFIAKLIYQKIRQTVFSLKQIKNYSCCKMTYNILAQIFNLDPT